MSKFTLTTEEDAIVLDALRSKANEYHNLYGATDPTLEALVVKVQGQFAVSAPVVEEAPKTKKSKAATSDE